MRLDMRLYIMYSAWCVLWSYDKEDERSLVCVPDSAADLLCEFRTLGATSQVFRQDLKEGKEIALLKGLVGLVCLWTLLYAVLICCVWILNRGEKENTRFEIFCIPSSVRTARTGAGGENQSRNIKHYVIRSQHDFILPTGRTCVWPKLSPVLWPSPMFLIRSLSFGSKTRIWRLSTKATNWESFSMLLGFCFV